MVIQKNMENKNTGKRILTDEELEMVSGGTGSSTDWTNVACEDRPTKEACNSGGYSCSWSNNQCVEKSSGGNNDNRAPLRPIYIPRNEKD